MKLFLIGKAGTLSSFVALLRTYDEDSTDYNVKTDDQTKKPMLNSLGSFATTLN